MYSLIRAHGKNSSTVGKFVIVDIGDQPLMSLLKDWDSIYVILKNEIDQKEYTLHLSVLRKDYSQSTLSFQAWLTQNGNLTLPVTLGLPDLTYKQVLFWDLWQYNFSARGSHRNFHPDYVLDIEEQQDILVSKSKANYRNLVDYCLFTVNGFLHRADYSPHGVYILDGGTSKKIANNTLLGAVDFQHLGKLTVIPITTNMVVPRVAELPLKDSAYIKLPVSVVGKTPMLSIGGYLHPMGSLVQLVSDTTLKINFRNYAWLDRYLESKAAIDLSSLGIVPLANGAINQSQFYSDAVILAYLTLSQSFVVLVDTPTVDVHSVPVSYSGLAGRFLTGEPKHAPLRIGHGRLAEYKATTEDRVTVLAVDQYLTPTRVTNTNPSRKSIATTLQGVSRQSVEHSSAHYLILSKTVSP